MDTKSIEDAIVAKTAAPFISTPINGPPPKLLPKPVINLQNLQANQSPPQRGSPSPPEEQPPALPSGPPPSRMLPARNSSAATKPLIHVEPNDPSDTYETYDSIACPQPSTPFALPVAGGAAASLLLPVATSPSPARKNSTSSEYEPEPEPGVAGGGGAADAASHRQKQLVKRSHAVEELLNTERAYLADCELCMRVFLSPPSANTSNFDQQKTLEVIQLYITSKYEYIGT